MKISRLAGSVVVNGKRLDEKFSQLRRDTILRDMNEIVDIDRKDYFLYKVHNTLDAVLLNPYKMVSDGAVWNDSLYVEGYFSRTA